MKSLTRHLVGGGILGLLLFGGATVGHADTIVFDNFNDNLPNPWLWTPVIMDMPAGDGVVSEVNQRLEITILPSSPAHVGAFAGAFLLGTIGGDFDISVGYRLLAPLPTVGPVGAGIFVALGPDIRFGGDLNFAGRGVIGSQSAYVGGGPGWQGVTGTAEATGGLRFTRIGNSVSAYYGQLGDWHLIATGTGPSDPVSALGLGVVIDGPDGVAMAFDDFSLQADSFTPVPEPASLLLLGTGLIGAVRAARKRRG